MSVVALSLQERDRRWSALQVMMAAKGLDGLIVGMTDFRGQKGGFRYLSDERPFHRYGYGLLLAGRAPILVLHPILAYAPRGAWIADVRFPAHAGTEMAAILKAAGAGRVGLVAADQVMRISDHKALEAGGFDLVAADALFETVRTVKSAEEIAGLEEAAAIADRCFAHLLDIARPGLSEREINGALSQIAIAAGADELLNLTMSAEGCGCAPVRPVIRAPGALTLSADKPFVFSIELSGPSGFWVELARTIAFCDDPGIGETVALCRQSVFSGRKAMIVGASGRAVQAALEAPFDKAAQEVSEICGHGIGHDVIEAPMVARGADEHIRLGAGMAVAIHPHFHWLDRPMAGYVADTYVMGSDDCRPLSVWEMELYRLRR